MVFVFSRRITLRPSSAARTAVLVPEHPAPTTTTSQVFVSVISISSEVFPGSVAAISTLSRCAHSGMGFAWVPDEDPVRFCSASPRCEHPARPSAASAPVEAAPARNARRENSRFIFGSSFYSLCMSALVCFIGKGGSRASRSWCFLGWSNRPFWWGFVVSPGGERWNAVAFGLCFAILSQDREAYDGKRVGSRCIRSEEELVLMRPSQWSLQAFPYSAVCRLRASFPTR